MASSFTIVARRYGIGEVARISVFNRLEYALVENDIGAMSLTFSDPFNIAAALFERDTTLEIYRTDGGVTTLEGDKIWLVRDNLRTLTSTGEYVTSITALDIRHLLKRRIVNYAAGSAQASKSAITIDNIMRAIVRENLGASASAARQIPGLTVEADVTYPYGADTASKSFAWRNVLTVLQELANQSSGVGVSIIRYISFDIIRTGNEAMQFQCFFDQRGNDHSLNNPNAAIVFSPETGSLSDISFKTITSEEATVVKVGGSGEGADRLTAEVSSTDTTASAYNYIEVFADARNGGSSTAFLQAEGYQKLYGLRGRQVFTGRAMQTDTLKYGTHYKWGDAVVCSFAGIVIRYCRISKVRVTVTPDQGEQIDIAFLRDGGFL